jgi:hypothetical protein
VLVPAPAAPAVDHVLRPQRRVGKPRGRDVPGAAERSRPTLPEPALEEVIQWPEQMQRATGCAKVEPRMDGVSDVAGARVKGAVISSPSAPGPHTEVRPC